MKEEMIYYTMPSERDGITLLIATCNTNGHGTRASAVAAKTELLSTKKAFKDNTRH